MSTRQLGKRDLGRNFAEKSVFFHAFELYLLGGLMAFFFIIIKKIQFVIFIIIKYNYNINLKC